VVEVHDEAVGARVNVLTEPLTHPLGRTGEGVPAALVAARPRLALEVDADAEDDAAVRSSPAQLRRHAR
jgi:hypothetical protein